MRKKILQIIIVLVAMCQTQVFAQNSTVTGKVLGSDNQPVAGASVTVSGSRQGTVTDANGNYTLSVPSNASLLIQSIGFTDQVVSVAGKSVVNITLGAGQSTGLEEVVVTGYTSQKKKDIVGSVTVVNVQSLKSTPSSSVMNALQGQAAGVDVVNNGSPGQQSQILIRGITTLNGNATPLVLIDGMRGSINDIPANDVESVTVLKDAGSAAIYGASGANGVIVITTKKGRSGAPSITYDSYYNLLIPTPSSKWNLMNTEEYKSIYYTLNPGTSLFPGGVTPDYLYRYQGPSGPVRGVAFEGDAVVEASKYKFDPTNYLNNYIIQELDKEGTDMIGSITNPALQMNQSVTLSGGNERATYMLALGYLDHQGTLDNSFLKRYTTRVNTEFKIRPGIRIGENLNVYYKNNPQFSANGGFGPIISAAAALPMIPIYDIGGNYAGPFAGPGNNELSDWGNERAVVDLTNNNRFRQYGIVGNVYAEVDFLKHFTIRSSFGGFIDQNARQQFDYAAYWKASGGGNSNTLTELSTTTTRMQWTNTLNYNNQFGKHNVNVNVGTESIEDKARGIQAAASNFFSTDFEYLVLANGENRIQSLPFNTAASVTALYSQFGRVDYNYDGKYLLAVTARRDGSSLFGAENRWGIFPSVSVGWRLSQEEFMKNVSWLNDLKIRASYGLLGNTAGIAATTAYTTYGQNAQRSYYDISGNGTGTIARGFFPATNGNRLVGWEEDKMANIGFDATLFNNKLTFSFEYYDKSMNGLLFPAQTPGTAGEAAAPAINVGDVQNTGFDISAMYRTNVSKDFGIGIGLNLTSYNNTIVDLPGAAYRDISQIRWEEGYDAGSFYGYKVMNVFVDQKEVDEAPVQQDKAPGRYRYFDADGNDTINTLDRVHFGSANPDFTFGLTLNANFKKFDMQAVFYSSIGNETFNNTYEFLGAWERGTGGKSRRLLDAWTPTNTVTNIKINELGRNFSNTGGGTTSAWMEDGSFFRLRNLQIGYNVNSSALSKLGIKNIRFYAQGTNLFVIDNYSGIDPEVYAGGFSQRGIDAGSYIQDKAVGVGLNVTF